ncbi:hypothetical protein EW145_g7915, partial [Phellinidium pouzarii]
MASPFFFVDKKDGTLRPCQDYRALNEGTIKNAYPLPLIGDLMDKLRNAKYFTKLDLRSGYNNIRIKEGDQHKAAFKTIHGLFKPTVMFFGLCNSPATFQMFMNDIFRVIITEEAILIYMDDILIFSDNLEDLRRKTNQVLNVLQENDLFLKPEKCIFEVQEVEFLGMIIRPNNIHMDPVKLAGIQQWPEPHTVKQLHSFLGFCNFYRRFIPNYSSIAYPLNELTRTNEPWKWNELWTNAFTTLKDLFSSQPALLIPDKTKPFILETDASKVASGAVLYQANSNGDLQPCGFISKAFGPAQQQYEVLPTPRSSGVTTRTYPTSGQPVASLLANLAGTFSYPNLTSLSPINRAKTSLVPTLYLDDLIMALNPMKNELSSLTPYSLAKLTLTSTTALKMPKPLINLPIPSSVLKLLISLPPSNSPLMTGQLTPTFSSFANTFIFLITKTLNNKSFIFSMTSLPSAILAYSKPLPLFVNTTANQEIEAYLHIYCGTAPNTWAESIPDLEFSHNLQTHSITKTSPFNIILGYNPIPIPPAIEPTNLPSLSERLRLLSTIRKEALAAHDLARLHMARHTSCNFTPFKLGDKVWLEATHLHFPNRSCKLSPKREGPFTIEQVLSPLNYRLKLPKAWRIHPVFHASLLTPFAETDSHGPSFTQPPPDLIDGHEEFEIEAIVSHSGNGKRRKYLIKWKGYPSSANEWLKEADF